MKINEQEEFIDFEELKVKIKAGYVPRDIENNFVTEELLTFPLYKKIEIDPKLESYKFFPYNDVRVEAYCNKCKCRRIFCFANSSLAKYSIDGVYQPTIGVQLTSNNVFNLKAKADCGHVMFINILVIDNKHIMKIGQFPSIYDLNEEINDKKFLKLLNEEYSSYYKSACSLYSFNTCIGAMVYLRRILEKILIDTFHENEEKIQMKFENFERQRMEEKINTLKTFLPQVLFEQGFNAIYQKISNGVHNLTEEECSEIFPILKGAIEEILIDKLELQDKENRRKELSIKLNRI